MYAMQYEITLPADYDMQIIHRRVEARGHMTDDFPGLGLKAYLVREHGADGSPVNQYAPFYLWHDVSGMSRFLWGGGGFQGIVADFGRPTILHWTGVAVEPGPARDTAPITATRHIIPLPPDVTPIEAVQDALATVSTLAKTPGAHTTALAVDPQHWNIVHFTLWTGAAPADTPGERYRVLHISAPHLDEISTGTGW